MCADNNMFGTRIMSVFGDGRNLFDAQGNVKINETLFRADLDAFFQIVDEVETARHVKFRIIFTLFDFRIADGELIGGLGEHPEIFDPSDPRRRQIIHLFRKNLFEAVYDPVNRHAGQGLLRENRVVWELLNEFTSLKPNTNGRSEADAMDDPAYRRQRETLHDQAESFFVA